MAAMRWRCGLTLLLLLGSAPAGAASSGERVLESRAFARSAAAVPLGAGLRLEDVRVAETGESLAFVLERFEVFAGGATITVHGAKGETVVPAPANAYLRGWVEGQPGSRVFLAVRQDGAVQGVVQRGESLYLIGGDELVKDVSGVLQMQRVDPDLLKASPGSGFNCANDQLARAGSSLPGAVFTKPPPAAVAKAAGAYTVRLAIESDYEFYLKFNSVPLAASYVGNLIGYASTIYQGQINTNLVVQSISLWTTSSDPWAETSTTCGLLEFGSYWNANRTTVPRTTAHFMSGKTNGGGVAWIGVLCASAFSATQAELGVSCGTLPASGSFGGGYGYTGNLFGTFNINSPTVMWDIYAVSHEIGHNFDSPHSHCYAGIGGNPSPIDQCYQGECGGTGCNCSSPTLPGPSGSGSGTIMSYCHLLSGSYSNITLTFGTSHPFGVQPGRESSLMSSYVSSLAAGNPACIGMFSDGFEGGAVPGPWSGKTP